MIKAEKLLKNLDLRYKVLVPDVGFEISPMDFMCDIKIILIVLDVKKYKMFIWKNKRIQENQEFTEYGNITDIYSYLYNFDKNNLINGHVRTCSAKGIANREKGNTEEKQEKENIS